VTILGLSRKELSIQLFFFLLEIFVTLSELRELDDVEVWDLLFLTNLIPIVWIFSWYY
jgi:hypothetical protein